MIYQLYVRKNGSYFANQVPRFQLDDLRTDLIEWARAMAVSRTANHLWKSMTDAIFRVENLDRYDDRDVIITNLLETYDRMVAFGQKHLSDPFVQEGVQSVSARDRILREICSNSLAHRDYSNGYVAKFVIERDQLYTENANHYRLKK